MITIRANNQFNAGERSPRSFALVICGVVAAGLALGACANQAVVAPFPDVTQSVVPPEAVMTVYEKDVTIEEMQAEAKRNAERAGL